MITWFDVPKEGMSPGSKAIIPTGNIELTENGEGIDVSTYATATVNVSGGGGGDFSTCEVTIINNMEDFTPFDGTIIKNDTLQSNANIEVGETTLTVVLYKNSSYVGLYDIDMSTAITSGDVEFDTDEDCFLVTGNGTITIPA